MKCSFFSMSSDFPIDINQSFGNEQSVNNNNRSLRGLFLVGLTGMYGFLFGTYNIP